MCEDLLESIEHESIWIQWESRIIMQMQEQGVSDPNDIIVGVIDQFTLLELEK